MLCLSWRVDEKSPLNLHLTGFLLFGWGEVLALRWEDINTQWKGINIRDKGLETPAGVVAQIQGHKPSVTAAKHYKVRPLELLRVHHEKIEAWILEQAGGDVCSHGAARQAQPSKLRAVK